MVVYIFQEEQITGVLKGIINIPLMKLEAIISPARLVSGVDTVS